MPQTITKYSGLGSSGDAGAMAQPAANNVAVAVESALLGRFNDGFVAVTTTLSTIPTGACDISKEWEVFLRNANPITAANLVKVTLYDGTNNVDFGVIRSQQPWGPIRIKGGAGTPILKVQTDTGTANLEVKVSEAGNPTL